MIFGWWRERRRRQWRSAAMPPHWLEILSANLWQWPYLDASEHDRLGQWIRVFTQERHWEGCGGLPLTDEVRVTIAGQAGLMVLAYPDWYFDHIPTILVYPSDYVVPEVTRPAGGGLTLVSDEQRSGEAWYRGPVILAWDEVLMAGRQPEQGAHLVVHEFAHQLDMIGDPDADGVPPLPNAQAESRWRTVMARELKRLQQDALQGAPTLLDDYGAQSPSEFFAVASECYFQRPGPLSTHHPQLFSILDDFYRLDPLRWATPRGCPAAGRPGRRTCL